MTSLLIGYPDIPQKAEIIPSEAFNVDFPHYNLISGEKYQHAILETPSASIKTITFNLGSNPRSANYVYLAKANFLQSSLVTTFKLQRSTDGSAWTDVVSQASFNTQALYGAKLDDWFATFATTSAYQYWRLSYTVSGSSSIPHSKAFLGTFLDLLGEPISYDIIRTPSLVGEFIAGSGAVHYGRASENTYKISLTWDGVPDEQAVEFEQKIIDRKEIDTYFLYTDSYHPVLDNQRVIFGRVLEATRIQDRFMPHGNKLYMTFQELIG